MNYPVTTVGDVTFTAEGLHYDNMRSVSGTRTVEHLVDTGETRQIIKASLPASITLTGQIGIVTPLSKQRGQITNTGLAETHPLRVLVEQVKPMQGTIQDITFLGGPSARYNITTLTCDYPSIFDVNKPLLCNWELLMTFKEEIEEDDEATVGTPGDGGGGPGDGGGGGNP